MARLYFEDAEVGYSNGAGPYLVSKEEIVQFAKQYDAMPSHIDEEAAARSILGGLTASAAHTFCNLYFAHDEAPARAPRPRRNGIR
jgi:acyl dehydratase